MRAPHRLVLLGHPVAHSLSPRIHDAALFAAGIPVRYEAIDVEPSFFDATIEMLRRERVAGNVTAPHKARMFGACEVLSPLAQRVGAVNTFRFDDEGRLVGDNTDVGGFRTATSEFLGETPRNMTVGILGAGGAAAAVLAAVEGWRGCDAHVYNRTPERARALCERFSAFARPVDDIGVVAGAQLVVNATSIGLGNYAMPIDPALLPRDSAVVDLVYRPGRTRFVQALEQRGIRATDGLGMLVEQAALAFETWFGLIPDRARMHLAATGS